MKDVLVYVLIVVLLVLTLFVIAVSFAGGVGM